MKKSIQSLFFISFFLVFFIFFGCDASIVDITPPAEVSNLVATAGNSEVSLTWADPADTDLAKVVITYSTGNFKKTAVVLTGIKKYVAKDLTNDTQYLFTVQTGDIKNNISIGRKIFVTPSSSIVTTTTTTIITSTTSSSSTSSTSSTSTSSTSSTSSTTTSSTTSTSTTSTTTTTIPYSGIKIYYKSTTGAPTIWLWELSGRAISELQGNTWNTQPKMQAVTGLSNWYVYEIDKDKNGASLAPFTKELRMKFNSAATDIGLTPPRTAYYDGSQWYNECPDGKPAISISPAAGEFSTSTIEITITVTGDNIDISRLTLDGTIPSDTNGIQFYDSTKIIIGSDMTEGQTKTVNVYAKNSKGTVSESFTYKKVTQQTLTGDVDNLRIYQVMVEAFQDGDSSRNYDTGYGPSQHKGDLRGIINALPYIKGLGMNALWLTPIFDSNGSGALDATGYFCQDYFTVDPKFGSFDDAKELVDKAHALNIYVFFDGVFGHNKGNVKPSPTGKTPLPGNDPVSYPGSLEFYKEVATYWIDKLEIDGWRLDQAYQVSTKNQDRNYLKDIREVVEQKCAERKAQGKQWGTLGYMVGEIWDGETNIQKWGYDANGSAGLKSCFDFPLRYRLVQVLAGQERVDTSTAYNQPATKLVEGYASHSTYSSFAHPNFMLTNHDLVRFGDLIQRAPNLKYGKENPDYWLRHKLAFSFMGSYTGPITVYYGDEIGDEVSGFVNQGDSGYYDDHASRSSGQISNFDSNQSSLKDYVTGVMNLRNSHKALWCGTRTNLIADTTRYADLKVFDTDKVVYLMNVGTSTETFTITQSSVGGTKLRDGLTNTVYNVSNGSYTITLDKLSSSFLIVE